MTKDLEQYLIEAAGFTQNEVPVDNPYREVGFDENKKRLGWVKVNSFSKVKESLQKILEAVEGKESYIFVGMGGSINGIKPLLALFPERPFYTIDNLDPEALAELIKQVGNLEKTLVISISKSGTTKETQLLSQSLKEIFSNILGKGDWHKNFLWLSDISAFGKLDSLGWDKVKKVPIQVDQETDIGGRFSSPHTLIFLLPLFLLLNKDFDRFEKIYNSFKILAEEIRKNAGKIAYACKDKKNAYFAPLIDKELGDSFSSWVVQLFQESIGSKLDNLAVKTLPNFAETETFFPLKLDLNINDPEVALIANMYFFQIFIAFYSAHRGINFVTQEFVEKYKLQMRALEGKNNQLTLESRELSDVIREVRSKIKENHNFIEIVLYFYPKTHLVNKIKKEFESAFGDKLALIFIGSDWNHQSYQAAFNSEDTFYLLLTLNSFDVNIENIAMERLQDNIKTLKIIAQATYLTLQGKSLLFSLNRGA